MQTFLPFPDFAASVRALDRSRLGKQRVETLQILRALQLPEYGWQNHPAVLMWRGRVPALVGYGLAAVAAWTEQQRPDSTAAQIAEFAPGTAGWSQDRLAGAGLLPSWLGLPELHRSHRSRLLAKDPEFYRPLFPETPVGLDYYWPGPDPTAPPPVSSDALPRIWVVRPESSAALAEFVDTGVVGFGASTAVWQPASGDLAKLRTLVEAGTKPPTRPLRALARFVGDLEVGQPVAVPVQQGQALLAGEITGDYEFQPATSGLLHRRTVRWLRLLDRGAARPHGALQDVRPLFSIAVQE